MSNFDSFSYFQTSLSLGVKQVLQKLPKIDINDLKLLFHCYILIPKQCNVRVKPNSKHSAPAACDSRVWLACCRWFWMMTTSWHVHIRRSHCFPAGPVELGGQGGNPRPVQFWLDIRLLQGFFACCRWFGVMTISWHVYKYWSERYDA